MPRRPGGVLLSAIETDSAAARPLYRQLYLQLRKAIVTYLADARGVHCEWQQIIVISGGQPAYSLVAWMVLDPSDAVWLEDPGQPAAGDAFLAAGAWLVPVPVDERGLNVAEGVARCKRARLAYVTPSRQHPPSQKRTLLTQAMGNRILQYRILFASEGLLSAPNAKRRDCWVMTLV